MTAGLLEDWVAQRGRSMPAAEAVVADGASLTYRELDRRVRGLAGALRARGVASGDRVALLGQNSLEFVVALHGIPRAGAICVPLNTRLTLEELAFQLRDAGVQILLTDAVLEERARAAAGASGVREVVRLPVAGDEAGDLVEVHSPEDVHSIVYTSGTTGSPRGSMLTFGNIWASATASAFNLGVLPGDRWLACMPLFHVGGMAIVLRSAIYGTSLVVHEGFDERRVVASIHEDRITTVSVVATMLHRMLDADERKAPPWLRTVLVGGGPVPLPLLERAADRGYPVIQTYGLTEAASQVATLAPGDAMGHLGSAGKPLLNTRIRIDAPDGEPGEILVAGPTITPGYFRQPEATAAAIRDGWLHTGDIGRLDDDGFLYVLDRRDDLIVSGGENVYPAEVEAALVAHPAISGAAVVGLADERLGQMVAAAIVLSQDVEDAEIGTFLRGRIAGYKLPRRLMRVEELPQTANGKVLRRVVRALFGSE